MNKLILLQYQKELTEAESRYDAELDTWKERAEELAVLFKSTHHSLTYDHKNIGGRAVYEKHKHDCFRTPDDTRRLGQNELTIHDFSNGQAVSLRCMDYEDDEMGYYRVDIDDFLRDDWKDYFTGIINDLKTKEEQEKIKKKEEKERIEYLRLKEKFGES